MAFLVLSTVARVKSQLEITGSGEDAILTTLLDGVSAAVEMYLGRGTLNQSRTEELDVDPRQSQFWLAGYPVGSITSIKSSSTWAFATATAIDSDLYRIESNTGRLTLRTGINVGPQSLQVVYAGGMASTPSAFITAFPDIANAVDMQVAEEFRRKNDPSLTSKNFATEKARGYSGEVHWLDRVKEVLNAHRRVWI